MLTPHPLLVPWSWKLYLYSPYGPYGLYRVSVPVQGCILLIFLLHVSPVNNHLQAVCCVQICAVVQCQARVSLETAGNGVRLYWKPRSTRKCSAREEGVNYMQRSPSWRANSLLASREINHLLRNPYFHYHVQALKTHLKQKAASFAVCPSVNRPLCDVWDVYIFRTRVWSHSAGFPWNGFPYPYQLLIYVQ